MRFRGWRGAGWMEAHCRILGETVVRIVERGCAVVHEVIDDFADWGDKDTRWTRAPRSASGI